MNGQTLVTKVVNIQTCSERLQRILLTRIAVCIQLCRTHLQTFIATETGQRQSTNRCKVASPSRLVYTLLQSCHQIGFKYNKRKRHDKLLPNVFLLFIHWINSFNASKLNSKVRRKYRLIFIVRVVITGMIFCCLLNKCIVTHVHL